MAAPQLGQIVDGFRFKGGNPNDRNSWEEVAEPARPTEYSLEDMQAAPRGGEPQRLVTQAARNPTLQPGVVVDGYTYKGGDPNDRKNWDDGRGVLRNANANIADMAAPIINLADAATLPFRPAEMARRVTSSEPMLNTNAGDAFRSFLDQNNVTRSVEAERQGMSGAVGSMLGDAALAGPGLAAAGMRKAADVMSREVAPPAFTAGRNMVGRVVDSIRGRTPPVAVPLERAQQTARQAADAAFNPLVRQMYGAQGGAWSGAPGRMAQSFAESTLRAPVKTLSAEAAAAAMAGAAGEYGEREFGIPETVGQLAGGGLTALGQRFGFGPMGWAKNAAQSGTEQYLANSLGRAEQRVQGAIQRPRVAQENLRNLDQFLPEANLSAAERTLDPGAMALQKTVVSQTQQGVGTFNDRIAAANRAVRNAVDTLYAPAAGSEVTTEQARTQLRNTLDEYVSAARDTARQRIEALGPNATREQANRAVETTLSAAERAARNEVADVWSKTDKSVVENTRPLRAYYEQLWDGLPTAAKDDMPAAIRDALGVPGDTKNTGFLKDYDSLFEIHGVYSKLRQAAREAAPSAAGPGNPNTRRLATDLAERFLSVIEKAPVPEGNTNIRAALDASRAFHDTFDGGDVGRILNGPRAGEGMALDTVMGSGGPRARAAMDALMNAVGSNSQPELRSSVADYLKVQFNRSVIRDGNVSEGAARSFMNKYDELLTRLPELRQEFEQAINTGVSALEVANPRRSHVAAFIGAQPENAIATVLGADNSRQAMRQIRTQADRDPTGEAARGLKSMFVEHLLQKAARLELPDAAGEPIVSGVKLSQILDERSVQEAARELFSESDMSRLRQLTNTARAIEMSVRAPRSGDAVINDMPSRFLLRAGRWFGAGATRNLGASTLQGQAAGASVGEDAARNAWGQMQRILGNVPAEQLIADAVNDPALFEALMTRNTASAARRNRAQGIIGAWVAGLARDTGASFTEEEQN